MDQMGRIGDGLQGHLCAAEGAARLSLAGRPALAAAWTFAASGGSAGRARIDCGFEHRFLSYSWG